MARATPSQRYNLIGVSTLPLIGARPKRRDDVAVAQAQVGIRARHTALQEGRA